MLWFRFSLQNRLSREGNVRLHHLKMPYCSKYFWDFSDEHVGMKQKHRFRIFLLCSFSLSIVSNLWVSFLNLRFFKKKIQPSERRRENSYLFKCGYVRDLSSHCSCVMCDLWSIPRKWKEVVCCLSSNIIILFLSGMCCTLSCSVVMNYLSWD